MKLLSRDLYPMKSSKSVFCIAVLLALFSVEANAQSYFGFGAGDSSWDITDNGLFELEDSTAFNFFSGAKNDRSGYEFKFSFAEYDWEGGTDASHSATNLVFSGLYFVPMSERLEFFGKLGLNLWSTDVEFLGVDFEGDDGIGIAYGLGLDFTVTESVFLRAEYEVFPGLEDGVDDGDVDQVMFNIVFSY